MNKSNNSGVGKTSFVLRLAEDSFSESSLHPGDDFKILRRTVGMKHVKVELWDHLDPGANWRFRTYNYQPIYQGAHGNFVTFDLTDEDSWKNVKSWMQEVDRYANQNLNVVVVGFKSDLKEKRVVPYPVAKEFCDSLNILYFECSNKTGANCEIPLASIIHSIIARVSESKVPPASGLKIGLKPKKDPKNCNVQ